MRNVDERYHVKKNEIAQHLIKLKNFFAIHIKTKRIKLINYFFLSWIHRIYIAMYLRIFKINVKTHFFLLQRLNKKSSTHITRRRNDNMNKFLNIVKNLKFSIIWLMKINLFIQFSLIKKSFNWNMTFFARLICYVNDFQFLILNVTMHK